MRDSVSLPSGRAIAHPGVPGRNSGRISRNRNAKSPSTVEVPLRCSNPQTR